MNKPSGAMSYDELRGAIAQKHRALSGRLQQIAEFVLDHPTDVALGTVAVQPFSTQVTVLAGIGLIMTLGVYGIVAGIVKLDDLGLYLLHKVNAPARMLGRALLLAAPRLMKTLTVVGTAAMFMVGGGILTHGIPPVHHGIAHAAEWAATIGGVGDALQALTPLLLDAAFGIVAGSLALVVTRIGTKVFTALKQALKGKTS